MTPKKSRSLRLFSREAEEIQAGRVLSGAETENTGEIPVLQKAEEKKQIVTAAGKVIETDAEEIIRQKAERGGGRRRQQRRPKRGRLPMPLCARRSREKRKNPESPMWPRRWSF